MRVLPLLALLLTGGTASAQPALTDARARAERDLFERVVEIPTVAGRGEMPRLTTLLAQEFRSVGITDIQIKPHGDTQSMIVRRPAAPRSNRSRAARARASISDRHSEAARRAPSCCVSSSPVNKTTMSRLGWKPDAFSRFSTATIATTPALLSEAPRPQ